MSASRPRTTNSAVILHAAGWLESNLPLYLRRDELRAMASKIRDDLDPLIAQEGPMALHPDEALTINNVLTGLQQHRISTYSIRYSRIHLAVEAICGKATRWPSKLADQSDLVLEVFVRNYGPIEKIQPLLFGSGGRLYRICKPTDLTRTALYDRFLETSPQLVDNTRAYTYGSLNFSIGKWWINAIFAFRDGVIDQRCMTSSICHDRRCAYAIVLRASDEIQSATPNKFSFRTIQQNPGFHCLTSHINRSTAGIRVFRTHSLSSFWAPVAGIRYDGLYKVSGWRLNPVKQEHMVPNKLTLKYEVHFERMDMDYVNAFLRHPLADELDDYRAYKIALSEERAKIKKHKAENPDKSKSFSPGTVEGLLLVPTSPVSEGFEVQS